MSRLFKILAFLMISAFLFISCSETDPVMKDLLRQDKLIVLTLNSQTTYYLGTDDEPAGFEYDLTKALADSLNVEVEYKVLDNIEDLLNAINSGEGHIAAAGLTRTDTREQKYLFGPDYKEVQQQVVCHRQSILPNDTSDLINRSILVVADSSYEEALQEQQQDYPELKWETTSELSAEQILEKLVSKEVDCTIVDSNVFSLNHRYYPDLKEAFPFSEEQSLAWVLPPDSAAFKQYINDWFEKTESSSALNIIDERYYGYVDMFDFYNNHIYLKRIKSRLQEYGSAFREVAEQYQIPWTLLAAQSYQESNWNPEALSHTGVRGLMMLTEATAKAIGIKKRTDPHQSIKGGAKYLNQMLKKVPEDVAAEDRIWFALAAYNIGFAHLLDARKLASELGKNPSTWLDVKEVFPLLSQKKYYKNLKYGYARGMEPVRYIDRIRYYQDVLVNSLQSA